MFRMTNEIEQPTTPTPAAVAQAYADQKVAVALAGGVWHWTNGRTVGMAASRATAWMLAMSEVAERIAHYELMSMPDMGEETAAQVREWLYRKIEAHPLDQPVTFSFCRQFVEWRVKQLRRRHVRWERVHRSLEAGERLSEDTVEERTGEPFELAVERRVDRTYRPGLDELLAAIPDDERKLRDIAALVAAGHSYEEIGSRVGIAKGTVSKRLRGPLRALLVATFGGRLA